MNKKKAWNAINCACALGALSGLFKLIFIVVSNLGIIDLGFNLYELLDVFLLWGLAFGVYKKSRICAVLLLVFVIISKIYMIIIYGYVCGSTITIVPFALIYFQGIRGTIYYYKNIESNEDIFATNSQNED